MQKQQSEVPPGKFFAHLADRAMQFQVLKLATEIAKIPPEEITPDHPLLVELREMAQDLREQG